MYKPMLASLVFVSSFAWGGVSFTGLTCQTTKLNGADLKLNEKVSIDLYAHFAKPQQLSALWPNKMISVSGLRSKFPLKDNSEEDLFWKWHRGYLEPGNLKSAKLKRTRTGLTGSYKLAGQAFDLSLISDDEDDFTMGMKGTLKVKGKPLTYAITCREVGGYYGE